MKALNSAEMIFRPKPRTPPNRPLMKSPLADVLLELVDDLVLVVEVLDPLVALEPVEPARDVVAQRGDLVADDRHDRHDEQGDRAERGDDDQGDRERAPHVAALEELHRRVEAGGEEQRDDDQHQHGADADHRLEEEPRQERAQGAHEADVERVAAREGSPGVPSSSAPRAPPRPPRGLLGSLGGVLGALRGVLGPVGRLVGGRRVRAQLSSSANPATTSRSEASWAVMESRRLTSRSSSALVAAISRWAASSPAVVTCSALWLAAATICSASRRARAEQGLALGGGRGAVVGGLLGGLGGALLGGQGPLLGLLDEALGLGHGGVVVVGGLAGQPLLLHREGAASLLDLAVGRGSSLLDLALGAGAHLAGLLLGGQTDLVGLALGPGDQVGGLGLRRGRAPARRRPASARGSRRARGAGRPSCPPPRVVASERMALASRSAWARISAASRWATSRISSASSSARRSIVLARPPSPAYDGDLISARSCLSASTCGLEVEHPALGLGEARR